MLIKQAIKILLTEDPGIAALVGARIYPFRIPQTVTDPCIAWGRTNRKIDYVLNEAKTDKLIVCWFEFAAVAKGPGGDAISEDIDDALVELLSGWAGTVSTDDSPAETLTIQGIFHEKLRELYVDDLQQYITHSIYRVHYVRPQRSAP